MFLRALLVGYVIGLGGMLLFGSKAADRSGPVASLVQKQHLEEDAAHLTLLRLDRPAR